MVLHGFDTDAFEALQIVALRDLEGIGEEDPFTMDGRDGVESSVFDAQSGAPRRKELSLAEVSVAVTSFNVAFVKVFDKHALMPEMSDGGTRKAGRERISG